MRDSDIDVLSRNDLQRPPFAPTKLNTCPWCGCTFHAFDISGPNPIEPMCLEPLAGRSTLHWSLRMNEVGCDCHNPDWVQGFLDQRARDAEEVVMEI